MKEKLPNIICALISFVVLLFTAFSDADWTQIGTLVSYVLNGALGTIFLKL